MSICKSFVTTNFHLLSISTFSTPCITPRDLRCPSQCWLGSYAVPTGVTSSYASPLFTPFTLTAPLHGKPCPFPLSLTPPPLSRADLVVATNTTKEQVNMTPRYVNAFNIIKCTVFLWHTLINCITLSLYLCTPIRITSALLTALIGT